MEAVQFAVWAFAGYCVGTRLADLAFRFFTGKKKQAKGKEPASEEEEEGKATEPGTSSMPFKWPPESEEFE